MSPTLPPVPPEAAALGVRELYAYGSWARGDADRHSDRDVLAVVGRRPASAVAVAEAVRGAVGPGADVAVYGADRLAALHAGGELFAWHLHLESTCLAARGLGDAEPLLSMLGEPAPYARAAADLDSLWDVLAEVEPGRASTAVYDAGLVFVVVRNAAVVATAVRCGRPDFSHRGWERACDALGLSAPLSRAEYDLFRLCRRASSGPPPPEDPHGALGRAVPRVSAWLGAMTDVLLPSSVVP